MRRLPLVLLFVATIPLAAQTSKKQAWELTLEERIALRTDPVAAKARVNARPRARIGVDSGAKGDQDGNPPADQFDGKHHPELFLPHQVFDQLVKLAFESDAGMSLNARRELTPDVRNHGLPPDFWLRLEALSAGFRADYRAIRALIVNPTDRQTAKERNRTEQALGVKYQDACRSRVEALEAARAEFGRERFDRFMYEVMAYRMFHAADTLPTPELLRQAATGCR